MNTLAPCRAATIVALALILTSGTNALAEPLAPDDDLTALSLEELLSVEVTSVSRKSQSLAQTAASVYVISSDDIARSGARSIPELLRYVPGLQVAQIDSARYAITARGNNTRFGNKLLVLMDGRTLYSPLFAGVFWSTQDTDLGNIERIEVIRGPGATLWGANAVNGVINIITKSARDTLGGALSGGLHEDGSGFGQAVYGSEFGSDTQFRVFAKYFDRPATETLSGESHDDRWRQNRVGFRLDSGRPGEVQTRVSGEFYTGSTDSRYLLPDPVPPYSRTAALPESVRGSHVMLSWTQPLADDHTVSAQAFFDRSARTSEYMQFDISTIDLDVQHLWHLSETTELVWGLGYRVDSDDITATAFVSAAPESQSYALLSGFVQAEWMLIPDTWSVSLGTKLEDNEFSGFEWQPSVRSAWQLNDRATVWGAVSRAVRTPSRGEKGSRIVAGYLGPMQDLNPLPVPAELRLGTNPDLDAEDALSYELGYRAQLTTPLSVDLSLFYTNYDSLRGAGLKAITCPSGASVTDLPPCFLFEPGVIVEVMVVNAPGGNTRGAEVAFDWQFSADTTLEFGASWLRESYDEQSPELSVSKYRYPSYQYFASYRTRFGDRLLLDIQARSVDKLGNHEIDGYTTADVRLEYRASDDVHVAFAGRNLGNGDYIEFQSELKDIVPARVSPSAHVEVTWQF